MLFTFKFFFFILELPKLWGWIVNTFFSISVPVFFLNVTFG